MIVEVRADRAILYVHRETGEIARIVYTDPPMGGYDNITGFDPAHPALLFAQEWDEIPLRVLQQKRGEVA